MHHPAKSLKSPTKSYCRAFICILLLACGCAGYRVGPASMFRADVRTVHVPVAESASLRPFLGERLTEAIVKEIESRSVYKVTTEDRADTILRVSLTNEFKRTVTESQNDDPRVLNENVFVEMTWNDRLGRSMMQRPAFRINFDSNFIPEGGQTMTTAQQESINRIARQVVNQMEVAW